MKDNPVQRLDLLEAQLARAESKNSEAAGRLSRTKHLLERLEKSGGLERDASRLRSEIRTVKQEIVQRKLFYAVTVIKRVLKQFKKVEPLRITKRLKAADTPAKKQMLEAELELVNTADAEQWASDIAYRGLAKRFDVLAVSGVAFSKRALTPPEINVLSRVGKHDAVHGAIVKLIESVAEYFEPLVKETSTDPPSGSAEPQKQQSRADPASKKQTDDFTHFESEDESKTASQNGSGDEPHGHAAGDSDEDSGDDADAGEHADVDTFFQPVGDDLPLGLPMMQQGYISGSEDESEPEPEPEPTRKNRRGQRARRKIWEQKFGRRANHVIKQEREQQKQLEEKQNRKRRREEKQQSFKRQRLELAAKPLHPSWEARQKEKERQKEVKFEGKKMLFD